MTIRCIGGMHVRIENREGKLTKRICVEIRVIKQRWASGMRVIRACTSSQWTIVKSSSSRFPETSHESLFERSTDRANRETAIFATETGASEKSLEVSFVALQRTQNVTKRRSSVFRFFFFLFFFPVIWFPIIKFAADESHSRIPFTLGQERRLAYRSNLGALRASTSRGVADTLRCPS